MVCSRVPRQALVQGVPIWLTCDLVQFTLGLTTIVPSSKNYILEMGTLTGS